MAQRKIKRFKTFIKDLVFNNPRADRQMPIGGTASQEVLDNKMLYDKKDEWNSTRSPKHLTIRRGKTKIANVPNLQSLALALEIENALSFAVENKKNLIWKKCKIGCMETAHNIGKSYLRQWITYAILDLTNNYYSDSECQHA